VPADVVLAMESSGLHSNGYSLVRHVLGNQPSWTLDRYVPELGRTLGDELLAPTRIYTRDCLALIEAVEVHAMSHITGGGLANNLARVIPASCQVWIDRTTWRPAPIFGLIQQLGEISQADLDATFNMGVGMVAVLPPESVEEAVSLLAGRGLRAWVCGSVTSVSQGTGEPVSLFGQHVVG
jgi:phosphoribosylformylglycinamidine cyclo-ligase